MTFELRFRKHSVGEWVFFVCLVVFVTFVLWRLNA